METASDGENQQTASGNGHRSDGYVALEVPENPMHRLTSEQIEEIGREFRADAAPLWFVSCK